MRRILSALFGILIIAWVTPALAQDSAGEKLQRWEGALTKIERREIASLLEGYETLITLIEHEPFRNTPEARDVLQAERDRLARFRQDMGFLDRRRLQRESA